MVVKRLQIMIEEDLDAALARQASEEGVSKAALVRRYGRDLEDEALRWLPQHDEREYSFVDATSFALMRSLRIREALAFDGDFAAAGFIELRA
jgi:predicted nucleic acid-binding protein